MDRPHGRTAPPPAPRVIGSRLADLCEQLARSRSGDEAADTEMLLDLLVSAYEELRVADEEVRAQQDQIARLLEDQTLLRWQQERMITLLPVATLTTDEHATVRTANLAAAHLVGMPLTRLLGRPVVTLFAPEERPGLHRLVSGTDQDGQGFHRRTTLAGPGEHPVEVELTTSRRPGTASGWTWMILDGRVALPGGEVSASPLTDALAGMATLPTGVDELQQLLQRAADLAADALADAQVTVTLGAPEAPDALASTGADAQRFDGAQITHGEGPCIAAFATRGPVHTPDAHHDPRWPRLAPDVPPRIGAVIAVPLENGNRLIGALNVYRTVLGPATALIPRVEVLAATIAAVVREFSAKSELRDLAADMERALTSRAVIDQAKGIIVAERGCTVDEAFQHLVRASSSQQLKLREVARRLVESRAGGSSR